VLVQSSVTATLASGQSATATTPSCPKTKKKKKKGRKKQLQKLLSAGGFQTPTAPIALFTSSLTSGTAWASTATNLTSNPAQVQITSQGVCV